MFIGFGNEDDFRGSLKQKTVLQLTVKKYITLFQ
jgi:hypothetical protein